MEVVFSFLCWVASFSHVDEDTGSKMDLHNIATVITPNVLYAKTKDGAPTAMDDSFSSIEVVKSLIEHTQEFCQVTPPKFMKFNFFFFQIPSDLVDILADPSLFASSAELTTKDIIKRCGGLFKNGAPGRPPPPPRPPQDTAIRSLKGRGQGRRTLIRVDTGLAQKEAEVTESTAKRGTRIGGVQTPVSGGSVRSGGGYGGGFPSTESSPRG